MGAMVGYTKRFKSTLLSLEIRVSDPNYMPFDSVKELAEGFGSGAPLKSLAIDVQVFSPGMICAIATNLPNLETLNLNFEGVDPRGGVHDSLYSRRTPRVRSVVLSHSGWTDAD